MPQQSGNREWWMHAMSQFPFSMQSVILTREWGYPQWVYHPNSRLSYQNTHPLARSDVHPPCESRACQADYTDHHSHQSGSLWHCQQLWLSSPLWLLHPQLHYPIGPAAQLGPVTLFNIPSSRQTSQRLPHHLVTLLLTVSTHIAPQCYMDFNSY